MNRFMDSHFVVGGEFSRLEITRLEICSARYGLPVDQSGTPHSFLSKTKTFDITFSVHRYSLFLSISFYSFMSSLCNDFVLLRIRKAKIKGPPNTR